ncbi:MAG: S-adenosylmethionine:tRNA ribosyltransferase-isomerase, partial [Prevotella sp.]|nr:S-adenosylmethionine:tRNA ribosyltransferase-isomerase [Prevotella sp.]
IPPYLNRESEQIDTERYQTLYARIRGSVAAPTAGLHFTEDVLGRIREKGIDIRTVCLLFSFMSCMACYSSSYSGLCSFFSALLCSKMSMICVSCIAATT